jgi:predicted RNase H-like HicB family nuclease
MRKSTYFAVFEPSGDGGYGVFFPDLPGCASYGTTFDNAEAMAKEALGLHIYGMEKDNDEIPAPSEPGKLTIDAETSNGYLVAPISIYPDVVRNELDNRAVRTNITIPAWLKELAELKKVNFSQLLTAALKEYLSV